MFKEARPIFLGLAIVCLLAAGCSSERSSPTEPTGGGGTTASALLGSWERTSANGTGCSGMVVTWDGTAGTVTSSPAGCDFASGQARWRNFNMTAGTIEEVACPSCAFGQSPIMFSDSTHMSIGSGAAGVGGITWRKLR